MYDAPAPHLRMGSGVVNHRNPPITIWERGRESNLSKGIEIEL